MKNILLVDDDPISFFAYTLSLKGEDRIITHKATDLDEAQNLLKATSIDLAVIDYELGSTKGTLLARKIREQWPTVRVIIVTGNEKALIEKDCEEAGADLTLEKPELHLKLKAAIQALLFD